MGAFDILSSALFLVREYPVQVVLALIIINLLRNKFKPGLVNIPGPNAAAYTRLWRVHNVWKGHTHLDAIRLHKRHGNLVRIGPDHVSVADPKWIPIFYSMREDYVKTAFYPIQSITWKRKQAVNVFSTRDPEHHRAQRRKIGHTFSLPDLLKYETGFESCTELFIQRLDEVISQGKPIDLGAWLQYYAFDVMGEIAYNKKLGFLKQGGDVDGMINVTYFLMAYAAIIGQVPELDLVLLGNPLLAAAMPSMETWSPPLLFTLDVIKDRTSQKQDTEPTNNQGQDVATRWVGVEDSNPHKMDTRELVIHLAANIFGGVDTTSAALRAIIYYLCKNPRCMQRLVNDIDTAEEAGKLSARISFKEAIEIPYLGAVVKESMRMHPSIGMLLERHVPPEGVEIDGHFLKGGTIVGINPWVTSRNADIFPNPDTFWPERWLEASEQHLKVMNDLWEFIFGAGVRKCIGRNISLIEMHKVIPELLRRYTIELTHPEKEWHVVNYWFTGQEGVICNLRRRK